MSSAAHGGSRRAAGRNSQRGGSTEQEGKHMREARTRLFTFFVTALILAPLSALAAAQDKGKEAQKPATGTVDAWRQALPPEAETEAAPEASAAASQPPATREATEKALLALERKWMG